MSFNNYPYYSNEYFVERAATDRFIFTPSPTCIYKSPVEKGREFEDYFMRGVQIHEDQAKCGITANVEFQKRLPTACGDIRQNCRPDAIFTIGLNGAIVEMKNYERTPLGCSQVDKTYMDMCALKEAYGCIQVAG